MRRFTGIEKGGLALAIFFVVGGLLMIVHPIDMLVIHPTEAPYVGSGDGAPQRVSREMARVIGGGAVLLGLGFASLVVYRSRE